MQPIICPKCQAVNDASHIFCPVCGTRLQGTSLSTSVGRQVVIYLVSFFLFPLGLPFVFKYLKEKDQKARQIGWIALVLNIISLVIAAVVVLNLVTLYGRFMSGDASALPQGSVDPELLKQLKALQ